MDQVRFFLQNRNNASIRNIAPIMAMFNLFEQSSAVELILGFTTPKSRLDEPLFELFFADTMIPFFQCIMRLFYVVNSE